METQLPSPKGAQPPIFGHICCGLMAGWTKMPLGVEVGLGPGVLVLDGDPAPTPQNEAEPPIFGPLLLWPNGWMDQDATWYRGMPRRHCVRWGPSSPPSIPSKKGRAPNFQPMSFVCQTAVCIRIPRGTEVGLGDNVLNGDSAPLPVKGPSPQFSANVRCSQTAG